jgi:hypothetical protein
MDCQRLCLPYPKPNRLTLPIQYAYTIFRPHNMSASDAPVKDKVLYLTRHAEGHHNVNDKHHSRSIPTTNLCTYRGLNITHLECLNT